MFSKHEAEGCATRAWRTGSQRATEKHRDGKIHASSLHECPRQTQMRFRGAAPTDAAAVPLHIRQQSGTAVHEAFLPLWAEQFAALPGVAEVRWDDAKRSTEILVGPLVAHPDLIVEYTDGTFAIGDLKTTHKVVVQAAQQGEPKRQHLDQCRFAGLLAEHQRGFPMRGYWIYYLDTERPEANYWITARAWDEAEVAFADAALARALALAGEETAPRWFGKHEGDAFAPHSPCLPCEYKSGCLGKGSGDPAWEESAAELADAYARAGEQVRAAEDDLIEYLQLKAGVEKAKRGKTHLAEVMEHQQLQTGAYQIGGAIRNLEWRDGYEKDDGAACARMLRDLGKDVPQMRVSGHFRVT